MPFHDAMQQPLHDRRQQILEILAGANQPVTGADLSQMLGVSRQVIVQDMAVLRAEGHQILATPKGYITYNAGEQPGLRAVLAVCHDASRAEEELCVLVDHGLEVIDVIVEHAVYGELRGNLMLSSRVDVGRFMTRVRQRQASLLSALTGGVHMHTVQYQSIADLRLATDELAMRGLLVSY